MYQMASPDPGRPRGESRGYFHLSERDTTPVLLMGNLENPVQSPLRWRDVGEGLTDALSRELRAEGMYDIWINPRIGHEVESILQGAPSQRAGRFETLCDGHPDVRYIFVGRVTDFLHVGEPTRDRLRGLFRRDDSEEGDEPEISVEAMVAIDFSIVDIVSQRTVLSDHVVGRFEAGPVLSRDLYRDMAFGSYRFWTTPLGRASQQAIDRILLRLGELPTPDRALVENRSHETEDSVIASDSHRGPGSVAAAREWSRGIRVERQINPRKIRVTASRADSLRKGQTFYLSRYDQISGHLVSIEDRDTGHPLQAQIISARRTSGLALLLGLKPVELDLRGALLTRQRGVSSIETRKVQVHVQPGGETDPYPLR